MATLKEISESKISITLKPKENIMQSFFKDLVTFSMIAFCVYISQDNTWWTFVTGGMFIAFALQKIGSAINESVTCFDSTESAIAYLKAKDKL